MGGRRAALHPLPEREEGTRPHPETGAGPLGDLDPCAKGHGRAQSSASAPPQPKERASTTAAGYNKPGLACSKRRKLSAGSGGKAKPPPLGDRRGGWVNTDQAA
jgi:hypothetical protein